MLTIQALLQRIKERDRLKSDLGNRKSVASQMRMKTLANLASDGPKKRRRGGDDDTFGANDEDWGVYRAVADASDDEDEEDIDASLLAIEQQLLAYDPDFTENHTLAARNDWSKSLVHMFLRGPWPFDPDSQRHAHQLHLNVERVRVPEVLFQPSIAGLDQAGLVEIVSDIALGRFGGADAGAKAGLDPQSRLLHDIFATGGNTLFSGFDERVAAELRTCLPASTTLHVRRAGDAVLDAWRGAAHWAATGDRDILGKCSITRADYLEKGGEYIKVRNKSLWRRM